MCTYELSPSAVSNSLWSHGLQPTRLLCPRDSPRKNTGGLPLAIFPTQRSTLVSCIAGIFFTMWAPGKPSAYVSHPNAPRDLSLLSIYHRFCSGLWILWPQILLNGLSSRFSEPSHLPTACWFAASNLYYSNPFQPPHPEWQRECARASPSFMIILLFPHCLAPSAPSLLFCQACRFSNLSSHITSLSKSFLPPLSRTRGHSSVILSHLEHAPAVCGHIQLTTWTCDVWPLHLLHWDMWGKKLLILL